MTLVEAIKKGIDMEHDIVLVKGGKYESGRWGEKDYAESLGWSLVGTITKLSEELGVE